MSGTQGQRSSARANKGMPPLRLGFEQNTSAGATVQQQGHPPEVVNPRYDEMSTAELEVQMNKARHILQQGQQYKADAASILKEFRSTPEEVLGGDLLRRFQSGRIMQQNALDLERTARSMIKEINLAMGQQPGPSNSAPMFDASFYQETRNRPPSARSECMSVASIRSTASRRLEVNLKARKELLDLKKRFNTEQEEMEKALANLLDQIVVNMKEFESQTLQLKIESQRRKIENHSKEFANRKAVLEEEMKLREDEVTVAQDKEQDLSSDDDSSIESVPDRSSPRPSYIPQPQIQTKVTPIMSQDIPSGLNQLSALPQMQHCNIYLGNNHLTKKLPSFDGTPTQWSRFKSAFDRTKGNYSNGDNMTRIEDAITDKAEKAVGHLTPNIANVEKVMEVLYRRFGREEFVLDYLVEQVKQCKSPDINKPQTIVEFGTLVEALVVNIENYGKTSYMNDRQLVMELVRKLPGALRSSWGFHILDNPGMDTTLKTFSSWLDRQVRQSELFITPEMSTSEPKEKGKGKKSSVNAVSEDKVKKKLKCDYCDKTNHDITKCFTFKKLDYEEKKEFINENGLCYVCLIEKHMARKCPSKGKMKCEVEGCTSKHLTIMHSDTKKVKTSKKKVEKEISDEDDHELAEQVEKLKIDKKDSSNHVASVNAVVSANLPIIPLVVKNGHKKEKIFALLDSGATCTIIEDNLAKSLGLKGKTHAFNVTVLGKETRQEKSSLVQVDVAGTHRNAPSFALKDVRTIPKLGITGRSVDTEKLKAKYPHLKSMQIPSCPRAKISMIIGFDNSRLFAARKILEDKDSEAPCAYKSLLGWYVCETEQAKESCNLFMELGPRDDNLNQMMKEYFSIEDFGVKVTNNSHRSVEDKKAIEMMEKYTRQLDSGRWETCLLWRDEKCKLPESYNMARKRLTSMEKKMDSNPNFAQLVQEKFADYINKGYLKKKPKTLGTSKNDKQWYLPWFFAFHSSKKPRLVFDGAAKSNGKCLNDFLLKGPDLLESLPGVLMRFRRHAIAVTADIKEMFHQVQLRDEDRRSQTILYRGMDRSKPPEEYEMTVLFFGSACSPSSALYVKAANAMKYQDKYPGIVEAINRDCYMDDLPTGEETLEQAVHLQKVVTSIHQDGGFPMVKWNSNNEEVYDAIPSDIRSEKKELMRLSNKSEVEYEKTLGLMWDPAQDCFLFELKPKPQHLDIFSGKKTPTKREICSILMSLFDPLGFLAPIKTKGLIIMQSIWRTEIGWDDEVPEDLAQDWKVWMQDLETVKGLRIERRLCPYSLLKAKDIQLHIFADASQEAYAAVAFLRIETGGSISSPFVLGKSRVAPLKHLTIPRMELQAAVLATRMEQVVKAAYSEMPISRTVFWSDSRTVLCWIRSSKAKFNTFVANRIGEILETTQVLSWRWVPTKENPADAATRSNELSLETWLNGPAFLLQPEESWPQEKVQEQSQSDDIEEINTIDDNLDTQDINQLQLNEILPDITRFSSWFRLIRATAFVLAAARRFKKKRGGITQDEMAEAKRLWIMKSQLSFKPEMKDLKQDGFVSKKSRLFKLSPKLKDGIIILDSRIKRAPVSTAEVRQPPILDPKDDYTKLMVKWFHHTGQHYGQERVINELRQQAWIIDCRTAVRKCKSECLICKKKSVLPYPPEMGQLPGARLEAGNPPFYHCGVDYFGPMEVKVKRSIELRYGVIFTCLATRAVHVDLAQSLETADYLNCLIRFINIRGKPAHIWSDNGTNFVGAERQIREHLLKWNQDELNATLQVQGIEFHFIPPASPHMGGCWERLIGDVKKILRQLLKTLEPSDEMLRTFFAEVTGILNSRPITRASPDPEDYSCLTPNDLLNVPCILGPSITGIYENHHRYAKSWQQCQLLTRQFWERWSKEYLPWLAKRTKWFTKSKPLKKDDLVIVLEDNAKRNFWKMGIVTKTFPGDGQVRKVEVKIAHVDPKDPKKKVKFSTLLRPTVKICPLSLEEETYVSGGSVADSDAITALEHVNTN